MPQPQQQQFAHFVEDTAPQHFVEDTPPAPIDSRNQIQKAFDNLITVTPEQEAGHGRLFNAAQQFGAGAIQGAGEPFVHPLDTIQGIGHVLTSSPEETAKSIWADTKANPAKAVGNLVGGAVVAGGMGEGANAAIAKIPSRARAASTLNEITEQAANTPVEMTNTRPALQKFGEHVATGGKGAPAINKLQSRITPPSPRPSLLGRMQAELSPNDSLSPPTTPEPVNFPEARKFYTNVSDVTQKPGFLRRAFEDSSEPRLRYAAGPVRAGLNADLVNSLKPLGRDMDYANAIKEYARAQNLQRILRRAAVTGGATAAGAAGLGKAHGIVSSVFK